MMKRVENNDKYRSAQQFYWQYRGNEGEYYLFSQHQLDVAKRRAEKNLEDLQPMSEPASFALGLTVGLLFGGTLAMIATYLITRFCG